MLFVHFFGNAYDKPYVMDLRIFETEKLFIHEEVVSENLDKLKKILIKDGVLSDPVLVDIGSNVVLDGTHRVQCFRDLGYRHILVALVDYFDNRILLRRWYRVLYGPSRAISNIIKEFGFEKTLNDGQIEETDSDSIRVYVDGCVYSYHDRSVYDAYSQLKCLEREFAKSRIRIGYATEREALELAKSGKNILITPQISKEDVVKYAKRKHVFPPKTTRHVFPIRPIFVNVPLEYFSMDADIGYVDIVLQKYLMNRLVIEINGKLTIDRYYEEDFLVVFL